MTDAPQTIRLDKWLWHARFFKSRSLANTATKSNAVRLNGQPISKPSVLVKPGDVVTFVQAREVRVVKVLAPGDRRGPAPEAQGLYDEVTPPTPLYAPDSGHASWTPKREPGGRPTGKARRDFDAVTNPWLE